MILYKGDTDVHRQSKRHNVPPLEWDIDILVKSRYCKSINFCVPFILQISQSGIKPQN